MKCLHWLLNKGARADENEKRANQRRFKGALREGGNFPAEGRERAHKGKIGDCGEVRKRMRNRRELFSSRPLRNAGIKVNQGR